MKEETEASPGELADAYFQKARDFLQEKLSEAVAAGHLTPAAAVDVFSTFAAHFNTVLHIAERGSYASDLANAAHCALTITMAAFTAGSRDPSYLDRVKRVEGVKRAARARESKAKTSASQQLSEAILALVKKHKKPGEDLSKRCDRMLLSARIKPSLDERVRELLREGFRNAETLSVEAIEKRLKRQTAIKPSDG